MFGLQCPKRVVHRDLKSPNVLVKGSVLKICDFGHSLALTMSIGPISGQVGTPCWMAPEAIRQVVCFPLALVVSYQTEHVTTS